MASLTTIGNGPQDIEKDNPVNLVLFHAMPIYFV